MNDLEIQRALSKLELPVFTIDHLMAILNTDYNGTVVKLSRLVKKGVLARVIGGLYSLPDTDPLCISSFIEGPSYISLWSALRYHGLTTQSPRIIEIINTKRSETVELAHADGRFSLDFIKTDPSRLFGYRKEYIGEHASFIADPEKTIVDCLLYTGHTPLEETTYALSSEMDRSKLIEYSKKINKQSLKKRLGYLMDKRGYAVKPDDFGDLSSSYVRLDPMGERRGIHCRKWHIMDNGVEI
ncbi:MAG: type IV toxin-antitoxin system AbiEi family antitoxin domain-containing protein [Thermoplasmatota archaeon]